MDDVAVEVIVGFDAFVVADGVPVLVDPDEAAAERDFEGDYRSNIVEFD